jgi:NAD(P)-dependent dehydrogenase (short-subunit alcohol dehydrogenase family)
MNEVTNKIAVITGGSRGLGRNTVLSLAKRGVDLIFTYHSNQAEAQKVIDLVADGGRTAMALPLDTGDVKTFDSFITSMKQALAELGADRFDYLVNRIVNISSGLARFSLPGSSAYGSMKGAVEVLTRYLARELGPRGIAVNTVARRDRN